MGYQDGTKGYRFWDRNSGGVKIIISMDVIFNKTIFPCKLINMEVNPKPSTPDDFVIGSSTQIEVEQQDLATAPIFQVPNT